MKLWLLLFFVCVPMRAMYFDIESQLYFVQRKTNKDHVVIDLPLKECGICFEDKHLVGSIPCKQGDKHPDICDDCMHDLIEKDHTSKGSCPFCRRKLKVHNLACSICKEKFKSTQPSSQVGCCSCFVVVSKVIRSWFA